MKRITLTTLFYLIVNVAFGQKADYLGIISELVFIKLSSEKRLIDVMHSPVIKEKNKIDSLSRVLDLYNLYNTSELSAPQKDIILRKYKVDSITLIKYEADKKNLSNHLKVVEAYNSLRVLTDQLILQLIADCKRKNNLKYFKKLDKLLVVTTLKDIEALTFKNLKLISYINALKKIDKAYEEVKGSPTPSSSGGMQTFGANLQDSFVNDPIKFLSFVTSIIKDIRETKEKKVEKVMTILNSLRLLSIQELAKSEKKEK